ncbi:unnamed protein product [Lota lota]
MQESNKEKPSRHNGNSIKVMGLALRTYSAMGSGDDRHGALDDSRRRNAVPIPWSGGQRRQSAAPPSLYKPLRLPYLAMPRSSEEKGDLSDETKGLRS